eukprot:m.261190 g.261190  ORF g.261190 m.261190 type:complete len:475 (-) comp17595_c0_seq2:5601-7025(-)
MADGQSIAWRKLRQLHADMIQHDAFAHSEFSDHTRRRHLRDFSNIKEHGHGAYSTVFKAQDKETKIPVALKRLNKGFLVKEKRTHEVAREKEALLKLKDEARVVNLYFTFQDAEYLYFAMELCPNGDLQQFITRFGPQSPPAAKFFAQQLTAGIGFCHSRNIVHRDIKPDNCLLDSGLNLKLCDFACSKTLSSPGSERKNSFVGTAMFVAPEILNSEPASFASDFWSLACTLYYVAVGEHLFDRPSEYLTFEAICNANFELSPLLEDQLRDLLSKLLVVKVSDRLGGEPSNGFESVMAHPYFQPVDWSHITHKGSKAPDILPYLPWQPTRLLDEETVLAVKSVVAPAFQASDACPFGSLVAAPVRIWDYMHARKGYSKRVVAMLVTETELVLIEPALSDHDTQRPRVLYSTPIHSVVCAIAVTDECVMVQGPRVWYLTPFRDADVDYASHPEHMAFVTVTDAVSLAMKINSLLV